MTATFINVGSILLGTVLGCLLRKGLPERFKTLILQAMGLAVLALGIADAVKTQLPLLLVLSVVAGALMGAALRIEDRLSGLGGWLQKRLPGGQREGGFVEGFMSATLIFCVGSMAILGSLKAGLHGDMSLILIKSLLDGTTSLILASTLGWGVGLSVLPVLLFQGSITLAAAWVAPYASEPLMRELSAVGGLLIMGIGINLMDLKHVPTGNLLPALLVPVMYFLLFT